MGADEGVCVCVVVVVLNEGTRQSVGKPTVCIVYVLRITYILVVVDIMNEVKLGAGHAKKRVSLAIERGMMPSFWTLGFGAGNNDTYI